MAEILLHIEALSCVRDGRSLFTDMNLSVRAGECLTLTGPNGSGKSTLLRCVGGLFPDYLGEIGAVQLEYLGHRPGVSLGLSPLENLRWYRSLGGRDVVLAALLDQVGLAGYEKVPCQQLSAGQQRRVALARLMLSAARLWLLDEPFTALDDEGQELVRSMLGEHLAAGGAAVCATHQPLGMPGSATVNLGRSS